MYAAYNFHIADASAVKKQHQRTHALKSPETYRHILIVPAKNRTFVHCFHLAHLAQRLVPLGERCTISEQIFATALTPSSEFAALVLEVPESKLVARPRWRKHTSTTIIFSSGSTVFEQGSPLRRCVGRLAIPGDAPNNELAKRSTDGVE